MPYVARIDRRTISIMSNSYLIAGCRELPSENSGPLSSAPATRLGAAAVAEAMKPAGLPLDAVEEVIMGNVLSAGLGQRLPPGGPICAGLPDTWRR